MWQGRRTLGDKVRSGAHKDVTLLPLVIGRIYKIRWHYNKSRSTWWNADIETIETRDKRVRTEGK